ncbi:hypothetical protein NW072_00655 [Mycoplasmopsis felis]|uniref:hypothetical protein n=1 Tax=Mycoplasmopsis felis TaxID=33923 RepID=UPI0021B01A8D|nr:hypothetical protein [Mycoplasmopsis felis]UWV79716.1 hypothetical protein NW072_00655 [Mycoplasmopsis felis]
MKNINLNDLKEKVNKFLKDKKKVKLASIILGSSILGITTIAVVASVASKSNQMNESEHLFQVEPKPKNKLQSNQLILTQVQHLLWSSTRSSTWYKW